MKKMNIGDVIVALDNTDEGFKEGQVCLIERVDEDDNYGDCYDVMILKAWTETHAYFGKPTHYWSATRIEEPANFQIIGRAAKLGKLGVVPLTEQVREAIFDSRE